MSNSNPFLQQLPNYDEEKVNDAFFQKMSRSHLEQIIDIRHGVHHKITTEPTGSAANIIPSNGTKLYRRFGASCKFHVPSFNEEDHVIISSGMLRIGDWLLSPLVKHFGVDAPSEWLAKLQRYCTRSEIQRSFIYSPVISRYFCMRPSEVVARRAITFPNNFDETSNDYRVLWHWYLSILKKLGDRICGDRKASDVLEESFGGDTHVVIQPLPQSALATLLESAYAFSGFINRGICSHATGAGTVSNVVGNGKSNYTPFHLFFTEEYGRKRREQQKRFTDGLKAFQEDEVQKIIVAVHAVRIENNNENFIKKLDVPLLFDPRVVEKYSRQSFLQFLSYISLYCNRIDENFKDFHCTAALAFFLKIFEDEGVDLRSNPSKFTTQFNHQLDTLVRYVLGIASDETYRGKNIHSVKYSFQQYVSLLQRELGNKAGTEEAFRGELFSKLFLGTVYQSLPGYDVADVDNIPQRRSVDAYSNSASPNVFFATPSDDVLIEVLKKYFAFFWRDEKVRGSRQNETLTTCLVTVILLCIPGLGENPGIIALFPIVVFFGIGVLSKQDFNSLSWHLLFLLSGGSMIGLAAKESGLLRDLIQSMKPFLENNPKYLVVVVLIIAIAVVTVFVSHTVAALLLMPVIVEIAVANENLPSAQALVFLSVIMASGSMLLPISSFPNVQSLLAEDEHAEPYLKPSHFLLPGGIMTLLSVVLLCTAMYLYVDWMFPKPV